MQSYWYRANMNLQHPSKAAKAPEALPRVMETRRCYEWFEGTKINIGDGRPLNQVQNDLVNPDGTMVVVRNGIGYFRDEFDPNRHQQCADPVDTSVFPQFNNTLLQTCIQQDHGQQLKQMKPLAIAKKVEPSKQDDFDSDDDDNMIDKHHTYIKKVIGTLNSSTDSLAHYFDVDCLKTAKLKSASARVVFTSIGTYVFYLNSFPMRSGLNHWWPLSRTEESSLQIYSCSIGKGSVTHRTQ